MNTIEFIQNDVKKINQTKKSAYMILFFVLLLVSLIYGFITRDDSGNALRLQSLFSAMVGFSLICLFIQSVLKGSFFSHRPMWFTFVALSVILAIQTALFYSGIPQDSSTFWSESWKCFFKGSFTTVLSGIVLTVFAFKFAAWPNRASRLLLSLASGITGALMLEVHCDSAIMGHVMLGHISQGIFSGLVIYGLMEGIFIWKLKQQFSNIHNIQKIG